MKKVNVFLALFAFATFSTRKPPPPKPGAPKGKRPKFVPFEWESTRAESYARAVQQYEQYIEGRLPKEFYPSVWEVGEDYELLKLGPGHWVEVNQTPKAIPSLAPTWLRWVVSGASLAVWVAPELLAVYGITVELSTWAAADLATRAASVIIEAARSTGAGVAELSTQVYDYFLNPGLAGGWGVLLMHELEKAGLRVIAARAL